jgi:hypothetical protein
LLEHHKRSTYAAAWLTKMSDTWVELCQKFNGFYSIRRMESSSVSLHSPPSIWLANIGLAGARASGEALSCSLFAEGSRQGHFFGFAFFTADFFALLLESPAVCSAIRYGPMSSFLPLFLYSLVNQVERVG